MINEGLSRIVPSEASFSDGNKGSSTHALQNDDQHTKERKMLEVKIVDDERRSIDASQQKLDLKSTRRYSLNARLGMNSQHPLEVETSKRSKVGVEGPSDDHSDENPSRPRYSITKRINTSNAAKDAELLSMVVTGSGYQPRHADKPWFVILPSNSYRVTWDVIMTWLLIVMAFYVPFRVCMYWNESNESTSESSGVVIFELTTDCAFGIDILLNFVTAYEDRKTKEMVTNPRRIALHYFKTFFILDLLATIPFTRILTDSSLAASNKIGRLGRLPKMVRFLRAMRLLKLLRVYKLHQFILKLDTEYNIHHGITRMTKMIMVVMLVTHIVACFWCLVGATGGDDMDDGGWLYRYDYHAKPIIDRYVASLYWSFSTLTTVGYGDISARTIQEQTYSMVMMFLGVSWFAFISSSMGQIMSSFDAQAAAVRDKMICVSEFIRAAKLPPTLGRQVRNYFDFKLSSSQKTFLMSSKNFDADQILYELSSGLRTDIFLHVERDMITKIPFFRDKVPQFIADMISMLQPMMVFAGDYIVKEGTQADEMFFLTKGSVTVHHKDARKQTLNEGTYFGEIGCMTGSVRCAGVVAETNVELQVLSRRNLNILLIEYPSVGEELKQVAKERITSNTWDSDM